VSRNSVNCILSDKKYILLEKGEIVRQGDEVDMCRDAWRDPPNWILAVYSVGDSVPDPSYPSHRQFRRLEQAHD